MKNRNLLNNLITMKAGSILAALCVSLLPLVSTGQIYKHDFGTTTITTNPYTVAPGTLNAQLSNTSWTGSSSAVTSYAGSTGQALSYSNSSGTPTFTLKFTVQSGYEASITSFNFWRQRSNTGAQSWSMKVNSTNVGSGTVPTTGAAIGQTNVSSAVTGLTGTVNVVITLSGASGTGTFRLDDFTLYGTVTAISSSCGKPTALLSSNIKDTSVDLSWAAPSGSPAGYEYAVTTSATPPASGSPTNGTNVTVTGLTFDTKYYVHLRTDCGSGSYSGWVTDSATTALPVEFIRFEGKPAANGIMLSWATAQEINNSRFDIEHSADGKNYRKIGTVKGKGNYSGVTNYSFTDVNVNETQNYYRLKQVDFDGAYNYSQVVVVKRNPVAAIEKQNAVLVYPNPLNASGKISYVVNADTQVDVVIYNLLGQAVKQLVNTVQAAGTYSIAVPELNNGTYFVRVTTGDVVKTVRVNYSK